MSPNLTPAELETAIRQRASRTVDGAYPVAIYDIRPDARRCVVRH